MASKRHIEFDTSLDKYEGPCAFEMMLQHDATHYTMSLEELVPLYNFMKAAKDKPAEVQKLQKELEKFFTASKKYLKALAADYGLEYAQTGDTSKAKPSKAKKTTAQKKKAEVATPASAAAKKQTKGKKKA